MYDLVIIGAGPAGLTAAYELSNSEKKVIVLEKKPQVGGLAETKVFGSYRYDIGPHRFFTKNKEVYQLFLEMLGSDAVAVNRKTRILFKNSYFDYPLTPLNALFGLGLGESIVIGFSYIFARLKSYLKISKINNFEDWVVDRFGKKLFNNFFKNYTEKVWGIDCKDIGSDWAAQRIKGLSLSTAIKFALFPNSKKRPKTLVDKFYYPRLGAGMLWEKFEEHITNKGLNVTKNKKVTAVKRSGDNFMITYEDTEGNKTTIESKNVFFSNPLLEFIAIYDSEVPQSVIDSAKALNYRNHISVHITIDKKLFDDNWIYIHSPNLDMARIADKDIIDFALNELRNIFDDEFNVIHSEVSRNANAYPVIKTGYQEHIDVIKDWLSGLPNITAIGRSGMFKYNNQDHAMATGLYAARTLMGQGDYDPWEVNVDGEYHEEVSSN